MGAGRILLDGPPSSVFAADAWETLRSTYVEPPMAAKLGHKLGLGSTPSDADLITATRRSQLE
jgi:hypothetical protein